MTSIAKSSDFIRISTFKRSRTIALTLNQLSLHSLSLLLYYIINYPQLKYSYSTPTDRIAKNLTFSIVANRSIAGLPSPSSRADRLSCVLTMVAMKFWRVCIQILTCEIQRIL